MNAPHKARKRFGQHFLSDQSIIEAIVDEIAPKPGQFVVEIGPGLAALTQPKRKKVRAERRKVADAGVKFVRKVGSDIAAPVKIVHLPRGRRLTGEVRKIVQDSRQAGWHIQFPIFLL